MTKTVTIDVPIEVRKTGPDEYWFMYPDGDWSGPLSEAQARNHATHGYHGSRAIVQAIDSGAFVDPLPTAINSAIYIEAVDAVFVVDEDVTEQAWYSTRSINGHTWHTDEQVQSYGPFEVLYDPEKKEG